MRVELVLGFVFVLFSFSLVAAASCEDSQTIMRMYSPLNSHVSAWDQDATSYVEEVCYDDIFEIEYEGDNPHVCSGINRVLSLYDSSNSHASETTDAVYNYEVCYGDLECVYDSSAGDTCSNEGKIVARMFSNYNTHVSDSSDTNYLVKVCCNSVDVYWADMNGDEITGADFGDKVQMIARGIGSGTFDIRERDLIADDDIESIDGNSIGVELIGVWTIGQEDLDKTDDYDGFYFEINGRESDALVIDLDGENDPMTVSIVSPACGEYFNEGTTVDIVIAASDADDIINGTLFVNGDSDFFSNDGGTFTKMLNEVGILQITAEATNDRGERSRDISNVMILDMESGSYVDGEYVAACIDKPKDFSEGLGSIVDFDASTTRGIRVIEGVVDELIPGIDAFSWYWTFMPEGQVYQSIERNYIDSVDPLAYDFEVAFPTSGDNLAFLRVEI